MHTGQRLKQARQQAKLTQLELAQAINQYQGKPISRNAISMWETTPNLQISAEHLLRVAKILNLSPEWLQFGQGSIHRVLDNKGSSSSNTKVIPLLNEQQLKSGIPMKKKEFSHLGIDDELAKVTSQKAFAMVVNCLSMSPLLQPGDIVIADPETKPRPGEIVITQLERSKIIVILKYRPCHYDTKKQGTFELIPINQDWPKILINKSNPGKIMGTVVEHRRKTRL